MQSKNVITIVHSMAGMCGMYNYMCVIWNTDVGLMLKYSTLLLVCTWRTCDSSFNTIFVCEIFLINLGDNLPLLDGSLYNL